MSLWDVTYTTLRGVKPLRFEHDRVLQLEADTISRANTEAKLLIGTRSSIQRIDPAIPDVPVTDPADRKVQGT